MHLFIQVMYGTVLGVSFYKIPLTQSDVWLPVENWLEFSNFFSSPTFESFISSEYFFRIIWFTSMLLIIAHDWYSYHSYKRKYDTTDFWFYIPHIFVLFFLAQMFAAIEVMNLKYWYIFGFLYTLGNIANSCVLHKQLSFMKGEVTLLIWTYGVHIAITLFGIIFVPNKFIWGCYISAWGVTIILIIGLWILKSFLTSKGQTLKDKIFREKDSANKMIVICLDTVIDAILDEETAKSTDGENLIRELRDTIRKKAETFRDKVKEYAPPPVSTAKKTK